MPVIGDNDVLTVGNGFLSAAALLTQFITRGGTQSGPFTDTTDTAVNIQAAAGLATGPMAPGSSVILTYINTTGYPVTIQPGAGVVFESGTAYGEPFTIGAAQIAQILISVGIDGSVSMKMLSRTSLF